MSMNVVWLLFICSGVVLPAVALLALRWALRQGEFDHLPKTALSIFDEDEPVGRMTDHFPDHAPRAGVRTGTAAPANPVAFESRRRWGSQAEPANDPN